MPTLALVLEFHHPLTSSSDDPGLNWASSAASIDWPLLQVLDGFVERAGDASITLAVSPSWTATATDPRCRAALRRELERRASDGRSDRGLLQFVAANGDGDALRLIQRWRASGAIDVIPTTASHTWIPSIAADPLLARAQVGLAAVDHARRFEARPTGIWLPYLSYAPGLETVMAEQGLRFFGVPSEVFLRGTVSPPSGEFAPMVTPIGVAAFAVARHPVEAAFDLHAGYGQDLRYTDASQAPRAALDHARHFLDAWVDQAQAPPPGDESGAEPISVVSFSAQDLAKAWPRGGSVAWLSALLWRLASPSAGAFDALSLDRYLAWNPVGILGRPGVSAGGLLAARPAGSDLFDRSRSAADLLRYVVGQRRTMNEQEREAAGEMVRRLLRAQQIDWTYLAQSKIAADEGVRRGSEHLARFYELAGMLMSGRIDRRRVSQIRGGSSFLLDLDLDGLAGV